MLPCNRVLLDSTKTIKERELASVQNSQDHCASRVCHTFQILKVKTQKKRIMIFHIYALLSIFNFQFL